MGLSGPLIVVSRLSWFISVCMPLLLFVLLSVSVVFVVFVFGFVRKFGYSTIFNYNYLFG